MSNVRLEMLPCREVGWSPWTCRWRWWFSSDPVVRPDMLPSCTSTPHRTCAARYNLGYCWSIGNSHRPVNADADLVAARLELASSRLMLGSICVVEPLTEIPEATRSELLRHHAPTREELVVRSSACGAIGFGPSCISLMSPLTALI